MSSKILAAAAALLVWSASDVQATPHHRHSLPCCVRLTLAGVKLKDARENVMLFDPHSGYYLVGSSKDIGDRGLDLVPDLREEYDDGTGTANDADMAYRRSLVRVTTLPRLRTGWGVNIGDTPRQVRRKLGPPHSLRRYHQQRCDLEYVYQAPLDGDNEYQASYRFHHGRLWSIGMEYGRTDQ